MSMIACYQMVDEKIINELLGKPADEVLETIEELQEKEGHIMGWRGFIPPFSLVKNSVKIVKV